MASLYGFRNPGGVTVIQGQSGWMIDLVSLSQDLPENYTSWVDQGIEPLVILNWGYGSDGTITSPETYETFAKLCSIYVKASPGCSRWIIGNEPNHLDFWPDGRRISPQDYASCYKLCRNAIHQVKPEDEVLLAAVAPWDDPDLGSGIDYLGLVLGHLDGELDGFAIHTSAYNLLPSLPDNIFTPFATGGVASRSVASPSSLYPDSRDNTMIKQAEYLREDEVILALRSALGNLSITARSLGISRGQLNDYMVNHPNVRLEKQDIKEALKDDAEDQLATRMMTNDNLLMFFLRTQARDRGYEPNLPLVGADGKALSVTVDARSLISAMRQGFALGSDEDTGTNGIEEITDSSLNGA